ncbi:unnamed protein product [Heterobilharzia americana]|nr:unnamed protein product [Heterobilharzia americana]
MSSASTSQLPSILSVDQGVDALSLEYSSNPYDGSSYQSSTVGYDPGESKRYRSVRFSGSNSKVDQEIGVLYSSDRKIDSKRLPLPIRARSSSPASSNSLYSTISEFSSKQDHMKPKSSLKSSTLIRNRQKLEIPVNVQTIPAERFILPDNSYSNTSSPPSSPKNLDNMTVTVKPRSHNLFSCYVPKLSTNDVEGIIRHVDSLMNPQIANTSKTNSSVIMTTTSIVDSEPSDIGDGGVADRKNYCFNPDLPELDLLDSLTTSEIMETSSEYNSHERLHSTREYYQLTSEEDLNSGESVNYNLVEKKDDTVDDKEASIEQLIITSTKESDLKSTTTNVLDTDQHAVEEDV